MEWIDREIIFPATDAERQAVRRVQRKLRVEPTGEMDMATRAAVRGVQRLFGFEVTGTITLQTAALIDRVSPQGEADEAEAEYEGS